MEATSAGPDWLQELASALRGELEQEWEQSEGWCATASKRLAKRLREAGHRAHMVIGHVEVGESADGPMRIGHAFVRVRTDVGLLDVDITADQFCQYGVCKPPVHITAAGSDPDYVSIL